MSEEMQETTCLTQEQQQRTHAVMTASSVLRGRTSGQRPLVAGGDIPGDVDDLINLAEYIVSGPADHTGKALDIPDLPNFD